MRAAAILTFHDAIELFLHLASEVLDAEPRSKELMAYFGPIDAKLAPKSLAQRESVKRLNKSRVSLKHAGTMPSRLDVDDFRAITAGFFTENTPLVFNVDLDAVSLANLIELDEARNAVLEAEKFIAAGQYPDALHSLAVALTRELKGRRIEHDSSARFLLSLLGDEGRKVASAINSLQQNVEALFVDVELLRHGIDMNRYDIFRSLTPGVSIAAAGNILSMGSRPRATKEEARFCYDFVIDTILNLQERQAELSEMSVPPIRHLRRLL